MMNGIDSNFFFDPSIMQQKIFQRVDSDGSGGIEHTELETMLERIGEKGGPTLDAEEVFSQFDADRNGSLNQDETFEMMNHFRETMGPPPGLGIRGTLLTQQGLSQYSEVSSLMDALMEDSNKESSQLDLEI
jgi:hypothetical protein